VDQTIQTQYINAI